jgi:hypothetical protein
MEGIDAPTLLIAYNNNAGVMFRLADKARNPSEFRMVFVSEYRLKYPGSQPQVITLSRMDADAIQSLRDAMGKL